jgi:dTDP-L-rhamnose 4-epimerase
MRPTPEVAPFHPSSLYGLTKQVQEQMVLMYAGALGINGFALRYQNVYGPGQSLKNPYTGILAVFSNQARANQPIYIFEDGKESRDFVYVDDVVDATCRCIAAPAQVPVALNVGSGVPVSVNEVVRGITNFYESFSTVTINGAFREGDIRHNVADLTLVRTTLGYEPSWMFDAGLKQFLHWAGESEPISCAYEESLREMREKGLYYGGN